MFQYRLMNPKKMPINITGINIMDDRLEYRDVRYITSEAGFMETGVFVNLFSSDVGI